MILQLRYDSHYVDTILVYTLYFYTYYVNKRGKIRVLSGRDVKDKSK